VLGLEARALMTGIFASNVPVATGVTTDPSGNVYVSHTDTNPLLSQEEIATYSPTGVLQANVVVSTGPSAFPGALQTLSSSASQLNSALRPGDILELQPDGELFAYRPSTGGAAYFCDLATLSADESSIYDVQTGLLSNFGGTITLFNAAFGDFGVSKNELVASAESNGLDFVMRVDFSNGVPSTSKVLISSIASDSGGTEPQGLAVNAQGTVSTTLPYAPSGNPNLGYDVAVSFNLFFDRGQAPRPTILTLGASSPPQISSRGITIDSDGNFAIATDSYGSQFTGYAPGIVEISAGGFYEKAQALGGPGVDWGIAVDSVTNLILTTWPAGYDVLSDPYQQMGYTPQQICHAYGVDQITFTGPGGTPIRGDGSGQTIAILDYGHDKTIWNDLYTFDQTFGLKTPTNITGQTSTSSTFFFDQVDQTPDLGVYPATIYETALDVEWAHAIAPQASILLYDMDPSNPDPGNLFTSAQVASTYKINGGPTVSVVSISYGSAEWVLSNQGVKEESYDHDFQTPNVTFLFASGDQGVYANYHPPGSTDLTVGVSYPASSNDVVAVGGTTMYNLDAAGDYPGTGPAGEIGWGHGTKSGEAGGSGGGLSGGGLTSFSTNQPEPEPQWQIQKLGSSGIDPTGTRAVPDVAWAADWNTGFYTFSSTADNKGNIGWGIWGGTSIATPQWAGLIAIADQERVQGEGGTPLTGYTQTLPALYSLPSGDFHDIVNGNNGYPAGTGYDLVTGLGSPIANLLVPDLAAYQTATTTRLSSSINPSVYGQSVTFTATVSTSVSGLPDPTGTVEFYDGASELGTGTLSGGVASFSTTALAVGTHSITAVYHGDTDDQTSTSSALTQTVKPDGTTTALTASAIPSVYGQSVTFTATVAEVAPGSVPPTGSVTFKDGATTLGTATLSGGKATFSSTALAVGTHSITAVYGGNAGFISSTSAILSQTIKPDGTTTTLTASANPSVYGQSVTFTAAVKAAAPGGGMPTGTVAFYDGATTLGSGTLSGGVASFSSPSLSVGSHAITVVYSGDVDSVTSSSAALNQAVNQASSSTTVVSSANPSISGQSARFTATVSAVAPGSGTPTGTVTFLDGSTTLGTVTLSGGTASFTTSTLAVGTHSITVIYNGDTNFKTSTSSVLKQVVQASAGGSTAGSPGSLVDQALAALPDDDDEPAGTLIHDLAFDQVSSPSLRSRRSTRT
jgi:hypothetical protein